MSAKLIFVRRSSEQIRVFGGDVFAEVDGKKIATIEHTTITREVTPGKHIVKMYKSHQYGSMIGFAESEFTIGEGETLVFRYSPPMMTDQPGHITMSEFTSYEDIESEVRDEEKTIEEQESRNLQKQKNESKTATYWWLLIFVIPGVLWGLYELVIYMTEMNALSKLL